MQHDETSYYEIALTTRQVVVFFVVLLVFVITVFLSGVWVGKSGDPILADGGSSRDVVAQLGAGEEATAETLDNVEELRFFERDEPTAGGQPNLNEILETPRPGTTLAQDVGAEAADDRAGEAAPAGPSRPERRETPPPAPPRAAPPPPAAAPPSASSSSAGSSSAGFVIQVFSTRDEAQARKVLEQLRGKGHKAVLSPVEVSGSTMYRVRVGPFSNRPDAEAVADRVKREMRLDTWVTAAGA